MPRAPGARSNRRWEWKGECDNRRRARSRRPFARKQQGVGSAPPPPHRIRSAIARRVMQSPAAGFVGRKHAEYIEELTRKFKSGQLDEALHSAIPLGGQLSTGLSLRLPQRRSELRISSRPRSATSVPYGPTVQQHLHGLYRQAAKDLEAEGKVDQAAYVLAELLRDDAGCVALFERHDRFDAAAQARRRASSRTGHDRQAVVACQEPQARRSRWPVSTARSPWLSPVSTRPTR